MNFHKAYIAVIGRIIEHGDEEEYKEMVRFYGKEKVIHAIMYDIKFLADYAIEKVCDYFSLKKEEIWCYREKQPRPNYWI